MRISTKALASLLLMTTVTGTVKGAKHVMDLRKLQTRFERILQRHDRKGELRAEIFGVSPETFRTLQRHTPLEALVRKYGFKDESAFCRALLGKLRLELRQRGWTSHRIDQYVNRRLDRALS